MQNGVTEQVHIDRKDFVGALTEGQHVAQLYHDEKQLIEIVAHYIGEGLRHGDAVIFIATSHRWASLVGQLAGRCGIDIVDAVIRGQLHVIDAPTALAGIMCGDMPDRRRFRETATACFARTRKHFQRVRVYGELADLLLQQGKHAAARRLEAYWKAVALDHQFALLCAYRVDESSPNAYNAAIASACRSYSHVLSSTGTFCTAGRMQRTTDVSSLRSYRASAA